MESQHKKLGQIDKFVKQGTSQQNTVIINRFGRLWGGKGVFFKDVCMNIQGDDDNGQNTERSSPVVTSGASSNVSVNQKSKLSNQADTGQLTLA